MLNENVDDYKPLPTTKFLFLKLKPYLDRINNIHALEKSLYSDYLGLAGRVDCIAEYEGELAIIDFKRHQKRLNPKSGLKTTSSKVSFYACMYYEMTGIPVQKLITIMVAENGECFVYEKRNKDYYIKLLTSTSGSSSLITQKTKPMQNNTEDVNNLIKEKFLCQSKFAQDIEYLVMTSKINYIEAIVTYCEENGIEFESVSKLISKPLKEKLKHEATQLNFSKKQVALS